MYLPGHFSETEQDKIKNLIDQNSFATVLSFPENEKPFINHLPIIFSKKSGEENVLIGHVAKRNPQWMHFKNNSDCTLIFHGGHTYITPKWYKSGRDVPTWNYAVVHLHGKVELIEPFAEQVDILKQLAVFFEKSNSSPWEFELPEDLKDEALLTSAIVSFKFHIERTEAKFKLSQNRSKEDQNGVLEGLLERKDDMSRIVRQMILRNR